MSPNFDAVVIPTTARARTISQHTLRMLADGGVPREMVHVFAPEVEHPAYWDAGVADLIGALLPGGDSLGAQRRAIAAHYGDGARVVQVDDDMRGLVELDPEHPGKLLPVGDVLGALDRCWEAADATDCRLWGVYPTANGGWMKQRARVGLPFICGGLFGMVVDTSIEVVLDQKEDFERTLRYYLADGRVVRLEWLSFKTTMYGPGGMQAPGKPDRRALNQRSVAYLMRTFPGLVAVQKRRGKAGAELRLKEPRQARLQP